MKDTTSDNVINFPGRYAIFGPKLREKIEADLESHTDKPSEMAGIVENAICNEIVTSFREFFSKIAYNAGEKLAKKVIG